MMSMAPATPFSLTYRSHPVLTLASGAILAVVLAYNVAFHPDPATSVEENGSSATTHFILLGATGDLAVRYLFPALIKLRKKQHPVKVYAASRQEPEHIREQLRAAFTSSSSEDEGRLFWEDVTFRRLKTREDFTRLCDQLPETGNVVFYLSIPPSGYLDTVGKIAEGCGKRASIRVVLEKPFGTDEKSAADLFRSLLQFFPEKNIYLVDHYKAKEAVQAIPGFFQHNPALTALLTAGQVQMVQAIFNETSRVESRIDFYDQTGILRDVVQNHLMEILVELLAVCPKLHTTTRADLIGHLSVEHLETNQYATYQDEVRKWMGKADHNSSTATFSQAGLTTAGLPCWDSADRIILTAGKGLQQKISLVKLTFRNVESQGEREIIFHIGGGSLPYPAVLFRGFDAGDVSCPMTGTLPVEIGYRLHVQDVSENYFACQLGETYRNVYENVIRDVWDGKKEFSAVFQFILNSWHLLHPWL